MLVLSKNSVLTDKRKCGSNGYVVRPFRGSTSQCLESVGCFMLALFTCGSL
jgi:hypothetical protein